MLSRSERIKYRGLFLQAYEKGKKLRSKNLRLVYTATRQQESDRLPLSGFTVTKKFSKKAVVRNKVKRRLREIYRIYRQSHAETLKKIGLLIICVNTEYRGEDLKSQDNRFGYKNLEKELCELLDQAAMPA